jgi:hypothetical protein
MVKLTDSGGRKVAPGGATGGWQRVEAPRAEIWKPGDSPGSSLTGVLTSRREVQTDFGGATIYEVKAKDGLWAVFARTELLRLLDLVWEFPGKGCEIRIVFASWDKTKGGQRMRRWRVEFRSSRGRPVDDAD